MSAKSQIPWFLAGLVLVAYSHCVFAHAFEAADHYHQLRSADRPLDNARATCENESACICKGATLAIGVEAPIPELGFVQLVGDSSAVEFIPLIANLSDQQLLLNHGKPPISGGNLRAQLQCFLL